MELSAILLARYIGFVETLDLDARGKVFFPELLEAIVTRFNFQKFPKEFDEIDPDKGVEFLGGKWGGTTVEKLTIYRDGILVDTRASTDDSERVLEETLLWATSELGIVYRPGMIKRKAYVSELTFYSDVPLLAGLNPALTKLSHNVKKSLSDLFGESVKYEPFNVSLNSEQVAILRAIPAFTIARRLETPFSENKYFSGAPLPTDRHLALLEQFESEMLSGLGTANPAR